MSMFYDNDPHKKREQQGRNEFDQHRMSIERANNVPHSITNMRDAYQQVMDKKIKPTQKEIEYRVSPLVYMGVITVLTIDGVSPLICYEN